MVCAGASSLLTIGACLHPPESGYRGNVVVSLPYVMMYNHVHVTIHLTSVSAIIYFVERLNKK